MVVVSPREVWPEGTGVRECFADGSVDSRLLCVEASETEFG